MVCDKYMYDMVCICAYVCMACVYVLYMCMVCAMCMYVYSMYMYVYDMYVYGVWCMHEVYSCECDRVHTCLHV